MVAYHLHVATRIHSLQRRFLPVGTEAVGDHLPYRSPVGYHKAVETPLLAQYILQDITVARGRDAVVVVKGGHIGSCSGFGCRLERGQVHIAKQPFRNMGGVIVAATFCCPVAHKVLRTSGDGGGIIQRISLESLHHGGTQYRGQVGIFTQTLRNAAPARIAGDIHHRCESPPHPYRRGFDGGDARTLLDQIRIERSRLSQRNRENRLESMDHITAHNQRNAQARLLHCRTLVGIDGFGIGHIEDRAHFTLLDQLGGCIYITRRTDLIHLADLLFQRHLGKQGLHPLLHIVAFYRSGALA